MSLPSERIKNSPMKDFLSGDCSFCLLLFTFLPLRGRCVRRLRFRCWLFHCMLCWCFRLLSWCSPFRWRQLLSTFHFPLRGRCLRRRRPYTTVFFSILFSIDSCYEFFHHQIGR